MARVAATVMMIALAALGIGAASAAAKPRLSFNLPGSATAATATRFSYAATRVRATDHLVVQRREGTAHAWRTVVRLPHARTGSAQLPALPLGSYSTRIADLSSRGQVEAQQTRALKVFGSVPFSKLFDPNLQHQAVIGFNGNTGPGVAATPTKTFQYAFGGVAGVGNPAVTVTNNACRSAHFEFVPGVPGELEGGKDATDTGSITIVQQTLDPMSATAAFNTLGTLEVTLVPGQSWSMNSKRTGGGSEGIYIYVNGYALCYSEAPFTSESAATG